MIRFFQTNNRISDSMTPAQNVHRTLCSRFSVEETGAARLTRPTDCRANFARSYLANSSAARMGARFDPACWQSIPAPQFRCVSDFPRPGGGDRLGDTFRGGLLWIDALRGWRDSDLD